MRIVITAIGFAALTLLSACANGYNPDPFAGWSLDRAQAACNSGNVAACSAANNLRGEEYNFL